jgi:hypothetical protein
MDSTRNGVGMKRLVVVVAVAAALTGCGPRDAQAVAVGAPTLRTIRMSAVEYKGSTSLEREPFPGTQPPAGGGYLLRAPDKGLWETPSYRYEPGSITVNQGDTVKLEIWGVNGPSHASEVEGYGKTFVAKRGQLTTVTFVADKPGIFRIACQDHTPSMESYLVVLART